MARAGLPRWPLLGTMLGLILTLAPAAGGGPLSLGTARGVRGVEVSLDGGTRWLPLGPAALPLLDGAELRATIGGALLDLDGGARVRVLPFSAVRVRETAGAREITLRHGRVTFALPAGAGVALDTPAARLSPEPGHPMAGELFVGDDGTLGLRLGEGRGRLATPSGMVRALTASLGPVFVPERPSHPGPLFTSDAAAAPPAGARAVFGPRGESLGYLAPGGRLVIQPGYTADLTGPFPGRLVAAALGRVPDARRDAAYPLFDVGGAAVGYLAGPIFYSQAVGVVAPARPVEVMVARDPAEVVPRGQPTPQPLARGAFLGVGDRVRTGRSGAAELRFGDGSLVRLGELSDLEIERLDVDPAGIPRSTGLHLAVGKLRAFVTRQLVARVSTDPRAFTVGTATLVAAVRQTDLAIVQIAQGPGRSYSFVGAVENRGVAGGTQTCSADRFTEVAPGGQPGPCTQIPPLDRLALQQELAFETAIVEPVGPTTQLNPYVVGGTLAGLGTVGGLTASGAFGGGGGTTVEATALRPRR